MGDFFLGIVGLIYFIAAWWAVSYIQNRMNMLIFTDIMGYFIAKVLIVFMFGWIAIPIALIHRAVSSK